MRVDFFVTGAHDLRGFAVTDATGTASYDYVGDSAGADVIVAAVGTITDVANAAWLATTPEIFVYSPADNEEAISVQSGDSDRPLELRIVSHAPDLVIARPDWGIQYHLTTGLEESLFSLQGAPEAQEESQAEPVTENPGSGR